MLNIKWLSKYIYPVLLASILGFSILLRFLLLDIPGGDFYSYKRAVEQFGEGTNPYYETIESFENKNSRLEHGYAYFPTLLYIQYIILVFSNIVDTEKSAIIFWKLPTIFAEYAILYLLIKESKSKALNVMVAIFWLISPYFLARFEYSFYDPLFLFFLLLALKQQQLTTTRSAIYYAIAISLKTIPVIVAPLFLVNLVDKRSINKILKFAGGFFIVFLLISLPFFKSTRDLSVYFTGSVLVHSERAVQGRPFLTTASYLLQNNGINFNQHELVNVYAIMAMLFALVIPTVLYLKGLLKSKYAWTTLAFVIYLFVTPVLSRSHLMWFVPFFLAYLIEKNFDNKKVAVSLVSIWLSLFIYLLTWNNGFEPYTNSKNLPVLKSGEKRWVFEKVTRQKYYEYRGKLLDFK